METLQEKPNQEDCTIGMLPGNEVAFITMPIARYALDDINGVALIYGKMREIQAHVIQMATAIRQKKEKVGILKVNGGIPELKVN